MVVTPFKPMAALYAMAVDTGVGWALQRDHVRRSGPPRARFLLIR